MYTLTKEKTYEVWLRPADASTRFRLLTLFSVFFSTALYAADDYRVSAIPVELTQNANAVVRNQQETLIIHSIEQATYQISRAVTVLNKNGDHFGLFAVSYDPQRKVKNIGCVIYDARGKEVKKVKNKDIKDESAFSSYAIFGDNRVKYFDYDSPSYPYTIKYSYEIEYDGILDYRDWYPVSNFNLSVEKSTFSVATPADSPLRYHAIQSSEPKTWQEENQHWYQWELTNHQALSKEQLRPNLPSLVPKVLLAPNQFSYEEYTGDQSSWQKIGEWVNQLNEGRTELPQTAQQEIKEQIAGLSDTTEIIRTLYEYMQSKTRYVSIQLGIGGYQPFEAATVDRLGYGDCKALSNYMKSILAVVGIQSQYTLVNAGPYAHQVVADFPSLQFNHAILGVPLQRDTVWLECTSQTNPFGYLSDFTNDRYVLMVNDQGGNLVKTSDYSAQHNRQVRTIAMRLDEAGNGSMVVNTTYSGQLYDRIASITRLNATEQKQAVYEQIEVPNFRVKQFQYELAKKRLPVAREEMTIELDHYASVSGKRWFFSPNVMTRLESLPANTEERAYPVVFRQAYTEIDTVVIEMPENLYAEFTPESTEISSIFGDYYSEYQVDQGKIMYIRRFQRNKGNFPAEAYRELLDFYKKAVKADQQQMVLRRAT
ncbi:DUF3857 domain-containing protein [Tunicatimonas pelagia]|uniref:DUF3857 domain-containing protein n=1 Tax=Tunicatimonas pelagia TaxID=931531 RepID=UPI002666E3FE|nr:DUF3857 domain-containing protein [Tunicatimonas pelagia]WKN42524.1 DUF3857 domain-containing protein [Tunicatimonas pelagia]